jgi:Protein of unknown function (DUF3631)
MPKPIALPEPTAAALLPELLELFREHGVDRLPTDEAVAALGARLGRPITANRLARTLKPYGIVPRQFRLQGRRAWGYLLSDLAEGRDAAPLAERRDAELGAGGDGRDAAGEWALHVAMHAGRW